MLITITFTLEIMQQLIDKPWRRSQDLLPEKNQKHVAGKSKNLQTFFKIA